MTDFFTRLAERALGLAPLIQPITASMFEPVKGISIQDDILDIVLEEKSQIEVTGHPIGIAIEDTLPPFDKPEKELATSTLPQLEKIAREPVADSLPPLERSASVPLTSTQELRDPSLPIKHSEITSSGMPRPQVSVPVDRPDGIPPMTILSSQVNEVHMQSGHSAFLRNRLESGESKQTTEVDTHVAMFPGTPPPSASTAPASAPQTVSGTSMQNTNATKPAPSQGLPGTAQHVATASPHTKVGDLQRVVLETRIMQGSPATKSPNPPQAPFLEEKKRQPLLEQPASSQSSPGRPAPVPEPAIQVTIGRIEVRAAPAPTQTAPPPGQHSTPSVMSLDDYLRQHAKGGR